ncbi:MAG: hypothetical protein HPY66_1523 [Firmicutes bacterium]|nr:hypothetical protein [Bacillota bacterium]MDI6706388.1 hypothetical protein [Bacillota bacterium]
MFRGKRLHLVIILAAMVHYILFLHSFPVIPRRPPETKDICFTFYIYTPKTITSKTEEPKNIINKEFEEILLEVYAAQTSGKSAYAQAEEGLGAREIFYAQDPEIGERDEPLPDSGETHQVSETGRQGNSKMLLSGSNVIKALSGLSWQDKLWLLKILSRCSMDELLQIKSMLEDGVTWEENKAMFTILRKKVTDQEQKKIDSLIEAYTQ